MTRLVLHRAPALPSRGDVDAWARVLAVVAAWPSGEPASPVVERRWWRAGARGALTESIVVGLRDPLGVLGPAAARAELAELARPLRAAFALRPASALQRERMDGLALGHLGELRGLDAVIPEGAGALPGLFGELLDGLATLRGPVCLSLLAAPSRTMGVTDARDGEEEIGAGAAGAIAARRRLRDVDVRLRLGAAQPLPAALRARAESVCLASSPHLRSWELAAGPAAVDAMRRALVALEPASSGPARADVRTAAITLALPGPAPSAAARTLVGAPVHGALPAEGPVLGRVPRPNGRMAPYRLPWEQRRHHVALFGGTGAGKTVTLERLILSDLEAGRGVLVIDPHGDLCAAVADVVGEAPGTLRIDPREPGGAPLDLLHPDPAVANGLVASAMAELWPPEFSGPAFQHHVSIASRALHAVGEPLCIAALHRWFSERDWRRALLDRLDEVDLTSLKPAVAALDLPSEHDQRLTDWVASKFSPLACGGGAALFDGVPEVRWEERVARGDAVVVGLPTGVLGEAGARMVGRMLLTRVAYALARQGELPEQERRPFSVIVDEAHLLAGPAMAGLFAQARKFGGSVVVATQTPSQLEPHLDLVLSNVQSVLSGRLTTRAAAPLRERIGDEACLTLARLPRRHLVSLADAPEEASPVLAPVALPAREPARAAVQARAAAGGSDGEAVGGVHRLAPWPPLPEPARAVRVADVTGERADDGDGADGGEDRASSFLEDWLARRRAAAGRAARVVVDDDVCQLEVFDADELDAATG